MGTSHEDQFRFLSYLTQLLFIIINGSTALGGPWPPLEVL